MWDIRELGLQATQRVVGPILQMMVDVTQNFPSLRLGVARAWNSTRERARRCGFEERLADGSLVMSLADNPSRWTPSTRTR